MKLDRCLKLHQHQDVACTAIWKILTWQSVCEQVVSILDELRQSMDYQKYLMRNFNFQMFFEVLTPYQFTYMLVGVLSQSVAALILIQGIHPQEHIQCSYMHHSIHLQVLPSTQQVLVEQPGGWWTNNLFQACARLVPSFLSLCFILCRTFELRMMEPLKGSLAPATIAAFCKCSSLSN